MGSASACMEPTDTWKSWHDVVTKPTYDQSFWSSSGRRPCASRSRRSISRRPRWRTDARRPRRSGPSTSPIGSDPGAPPQPLAQQTHDRSRPLDDTAATKGARGYACEVLERRKSVNLPDVVLRHGCSAMLFIAFQQPLHEREPEAGQVLEVIKSLAEGGRLEIEDPAQMAGVVEGQVRRVEIPMYQDGLQGRARTQERSPGRTGIRSPRLPSASSAPSIWSRSSR